jgi:hypothetical protein
MNTNNNSNVSNEELLSMINNLVHDTKSKNNTQASATATQSEPEQEFDPMGTPAQPEQTAQSNKYENMSNEEFSSSMEDLFKEFKKQRANNNVDADTANKQAAEELYNRAVESNEAEQRKQRQVDVSKWNTNNVPDEHDSNGNRTQVSKSAQIDEDVPVEEASFTIDENGNHVNNVRASQQGNAFKITKDKLVIPKTTGIHFIQRRKKLLFESETGTSYMYKIMWQTLIREAIKPNTASMITQFGICGGVIRVMGKEVDPSDFEDDNFGITVYDILEFHTLFKELPMLRILALDDEAENRLYMAYGFNCENIWEVFKEAPHLQVIRITDGKVTKLEWKRGDFSKHADEYEAALNKAKLKTELQYKCDVINPRKDKMTKGKLHSVKNVEKNLMKMSFGSAKDALFDTKHVNLLKTSLFTVLGLGVVGVWAGTAIIGGAGKFIMDKVTKDK